MPKPNHPIHVNGMLTPCKPAISPPLEGLRTYSGSPVIDILWTIHGETRPFFGSPAAYVRGRRFETTRSRVIFEGKESY